MATGKTPWDNTSGWEHVKIENEHYLALKKVGGIKYSRESMATLSRSPTNMWNVNHPAIMINNAQVDICTDYKYLGIVLDNRLRFEQHVTEQCKKVSRNSIM